jgi:hypothetical protein
MQNEAGKDVSRALSLPRIFYSHDGHRFVAFVKLRLASSSAYLLPRCRYHRWTCTSHASGEWSMLSIASHLPMIHVFALERSVLVLAAAAQCFSKLLATTAGDNWRMSLQ